MHLNPTYLALFSIPWFVHAQDDVDTVPVESRNHWMRRSVDALAELTGSPCPFEAFGSAIVNHSDTTNSEHGELICIGANSIIQNGNPTLHGEIAAINNCSRILTSEPYNLVGREALGAFQGLSLYTTAEACPMCATAIRWAGFKDYVYATSLDTLVKQSWPQISLSSSQIFEKASSLPTKTRMVPHVLADETDPLFAWQFNENGKCPPGCRRSRIGEKTNNPAAVGDTKRTCVPGDKGDEDGLAGELADEAVAGAAKGLRGLWTALFNLFKVAAPVGDEL
ncbi:hypothetical protein PV10_06276 [Exophiala mesophila]|uniref:CMP/dCMP-type deaminase domain-containing protein n=1 Tax=Exophiala mesophila TaxID=212818 RepID=A0A0D1WRJ6_EXOME|nr:uncharacterized protein PV10_06276 [Exophiala mesophila]KIV91770.1 hypothetical protein PV10_06276 [Exophiala mesophila]